MEFQFPLGKGSGIAIEDGVFYTELCREIIQFVYDHPDILVPKHIISTFVFCPS